MFWNLSVFKVTHIEAAEEWTGNKLPQPWSPPFPAPGNLFQKFQPQSYLLNTRWLHTLPQESANHSVVLNSTPPSSVILKNPINSIKVPGFACSVCEVRNVHPGPSFHSLHPLRNFNFLLQHWGWWKQSLWQPKARLLLFILGWS